MLKMHKTGSSVFSGKKAIFKVIASVRPWTINRPEVEARFHLMGHFDSSTLGV